MEKKLNLDTKMCDATLSLSHINVKSSKQMEAQLEAAECKVMVTQRGYWHILECTSNHCAGVLGYSVRKMEKATNTLANGYDCNGLGTETPNSGSTKNSLTSSSTACFDGAHLFTSHVDAQLPRLPPLSSDVAELEAKVRAATESLSTANKQQAEMAHGLEAESGQATEMERLLANVQWVADANIQQKEEEMSALERQLAGHSQDDHSLKGVLLSLSSHLSSLSEVLEGHDKAHSEWESLHECLESELQSTYREHQLVTAELEALQREHDEAKQEIIEFDLHIKALSASTVHHGPPIEYKGEIANVMTLLQPTWAVLPAPELHAPTLKSQRHLHVASSTSSPGGQSRSGLSSLSDMDMRSLKALYDAKSPQSAVRGPFSIEAFVALIQFVQAHNMLKKNAERVQKLAQDSNAALEMYQKHVAALENQIHTLVERQMNEIEELRNSVECVVADKREIKMHAADQAETCRQLMEANSVLSTKTLALAQEAAAAPEVICKQMESQLSECREKLCKAEEEIHTMQTSEQTQWIVLLDELNSMQTVNASLQVQLRAAKQ
ncbi:hypothetical protein EDC04DRAFT_3093366 [Pisolithus marmoratus]|nr:hypothetical protein EDC04DRAFT_3093366 [Pisolithus marmoratus]